MSRRGKPVYYPWYAPDWLSDGKVQRLPIAARGLYRELLDHAWMDGGVLDLDGVWRALGISEQEWDELWPLVEPFWVQEPGQPAGQPGGQPGGQPRYSNPKLSQVIEDHNNYRAEQRRKSLLGVEARLAIKKADLPSPTGSSTGLPMGDPSRAGGGGGGVSSSSSCSSGGSAEGGKPRGLFPPLLERHAFDDLDGKLLAALQDWKEMRVKKRAPVTNKAAARAVKKLADLSAGHAPTAVAIVEQSVDHSWAGFFELDSSPRGAGGRRFTGKMAFMNDITVVPNREDVT